jgi:hypothetical protein
VDAFAPRPKNDWKSWHSLWRVVPLLVAVLIFASRATRENDAASMQRTSFGRITNCERSGRSGYFCNYEFPVDGDQYTGSSQSDDYIAYGKTVVVYYNSQDLTMTALEDFSGQSRKDWNFVYILLLFTAAFVAFALYRKATDQKDSKQRTP